jgi:hypothetical protein
MSPTLSHLGGGERSREQAEEVIGGPTPNRCTAQSYWLVSRVVSLQSSGGRHRKS